MTERLVIGVNIEPEPWMRDAACRKRTDEFFPDPDETNKAATARLNAHAVAICRTCPVVEPCLAYAMDRNETFGVWGCMTPAQRKALRQQQMREGRRR